MRDEYSQFTEYDLQCAADVIGILIIGGIGLILIAGVIFFVW